MKSLLASLVLLLAVATPVFAEEATVSASPLPDVLGLYDEELDSSDSASVSATPTATPAARTTTYMDTSDTPVSGSFETTLITLGLGILFILGGIRFTKSE